MPIRHGSGSRLRLTSTPAAREIASMELRSLHYFVRIAELGSITRASAHLQIAQPALTRCVADAQSFPVADRYARECLSLPLFVGMTESQVDRVCATIRRFYR